MAKEFNYYEIERKYPEKSFMGVRGDQKVYLAQPSWDGGLRWNFGILSDGTPINYLNKKINLHDGLVEYFGDSFAIRKSDRWEFAELFKTFYSLQEAAEVLGRGGSYYIENNPCAEIIKNPDEVKRINEVVLPAIFEAIYKIIGRNKNNNKLFKKIVELNVEGDTDKVVKFMMKHKFHPRDIDHVEGITWNDSMVIHSKYREETKKNKS